MSLPRFYRKHPPLWATLLFVGAILVGIRVFYWTLNEPSGASSPPALKEGDYLVERVVDGDTVVIQVNENRKTSTYYVRLLGVDAPETVKPNHPVEPWGIEASNFTRDFVAKGQVTLRFGRRRIDRYDRLLAYVFVDESMLNAELARAGLAKVKIYAGDQSTYSRQIEKAEAQAQAAKVGVWSTQ